MPKCEKETLAQLLSCKFCEILRNSFFIEHLQTTVSSAGDKFSSILSVNLITKNSSFQSNRNTEDEKY